jgi:hypothetical protein
MTTEPWKDRINAVAEQYRGLPIEEVQQALTEAVKDMPEFWDPVGDWIASTSGKISRGTVYRIQ